MGMYFAFKLFSTLACTGVVMEYPCCIVHPLLCVQLSLVERGGGGVQQGYLFLAWGHMLNTYLPCKSRVWGL